MVKCGECGLFTLRNRETGQFGEADAEVRENGQVARGVEWQDAHQPLCFARKYDLFAEIRALGDPDDPNMRGDPARRVSGRNTRAVLDQERECDGFTTYKQGFTPKEHQEMVDRQWLLRFQTEREDADRRWRDRQWRETQAWQRRNLIALVLVTGVVSTLATLANAYIQRGVIGPQPAAPTPLVIPAPQVVVVVPTAPPAPTNSPATPTVPPASAG